MAIISPIMNIYVRNVYSETLILLERKR